MSHIAPRALTNDSRRPRPARAVVAASAAAAALMAAFGPCQAACPVGDPTVIYCDDFAGAHPLDNYSSIDSVPPWTIAIVDEALNFAASDGPFRVTWLLSKSPQSYRNTLLETDVRFDTDDAMLRSAIAPNWANTELDARLQVALQLDEKRFSIYVQAGTQTASRGLYWPVEPNRTYRLGLRIEEVPGTLPARPTVLGFKGYVDGALVMSETEDTLGVDLSALPPQLSPGFHGASHILSPVIQVIDNAIVRKAMQFACAGFEAPLQKGPVTAAKNRTLPLKMTLADAQGLPVTDLGSVPPVIRVMHTPQGGTPVDVTALAAAAGRGTAAGQFVYGDGKWQFNLQTKAYSAPGSYEVSVQPGSAYSIEPTCTATFTVR